MRPAIYSVLILFNFLPFILTGQDYCHAVMLDTLGYPPVSPPSNYMFESSHGENYGYLGGTNTYHDKAKAEFYTTTNSNFKGISGVRLKFAVAKGSGEVKIAIWNATSIGTPYNLMYEQSVSIPDLALDVESNRYTDVMFTTVVSNPGKFFCGIEIPETAGDTIAVYTTTTGTSSSSNGWELWKSNSWHNFFESYGGRFNVELYIFPFVTDTEGSNGLNPEQSSGLSIFPNPANTKLEIVSPVRIPFGGSIAVYSVSGECVIQKTPGQTSGHLQESLDVSNLRQGIYFLSLDARSQKLTKKFVIQR